MPCLEISMPPVTVEVRRDLVQRLTDVFDEATSFGRDIFAIRFYEYQPGLTAIGGDLCEKDVKSPYLHFLLYCPRIDRATKQRLVAGWTEAFATCLDRPDWMPVIHLCEHPYDNVGVGGALLSDAFPACAESRFYYELPGD